MPNDYDQLMQEDAAARQRQGEMLANLINNVTPDSHGWEYPPLDRPITAKECLAVLEAAHASGIVEWESWHEGG